MLMRYERRLQEIERVLQNMHREGEIVEVKYDDEKKRWFVKMNDGEDKTPSGKPAKDKTTFRSDWLPWNSFSHGTISYSVPPRVGQKVAMWSPNGQPEMAVCTPSQYGKKTPSPHGKQDEIVRVIESPEEDKDQASGDGSNASTGSSQSGQNSDKYENWIRETETGHHIIIRKKKAKQSSSGQVSGSSSGKSDSKDSGKPTVERKLPEIPEDGEENAIQVKTTKDGYLVTIGDKVKIQGSSGKLFLKQDGCTLTMENGNLKIKAATVEIDGNETVIKGTTYLGGKSGAKGLHLKDMLDSDGDSAVQASSTVFAV